MVANITQAVVVPVMEQPEQPEQPEQLAQPDQLVQRELVQPD
jgi:hypothetical protein